MALYLIGDVQGCDGALQRLLHTLDFSPSRDTLYLLGDLVNRGPDSAALLRRLMALGPAAQCLLGNHDLSLLAIAYGAGRVRVGDTLADLLNAPDRTALIDWLRGQPLARFEHGCLMVHAGVLPSWSATQTLALAHEVETVLRGPQADVRSFLQALYGNTPAAWSDALRGTERLRTIANVLTRMRFCRADGRMDFDYRGEVVDAPTDLQPWFELPGRQTASLPVAFGHWSQLGLLLRPNLLSLDTGCVWGGCLSACRWHIEPAQREIIQVGCEAAQLPGR